jgi:hypothetical protein
MTTWEDVSAAHRTAMVKYRALLAAYARLRWVDYLLGGWSRRYRVWLLASVDCATANSQAMVLCDQYRREQDKAWQERFSDPSAWATVGVDPPHMLQ